MDNPNAFRFFIVDLFDGTVRGSNDSDAADSYAECEDFFVIDIHTAQCATWRTTDGHEAITEK